MSKSGASFFTRARSNVMSPEVSESGNERIFVVESLFRYVRLSCRCLVAERNRTPNSYSGPKILSLIETKGKRGSLPFVVFIIVQNSVSAIVFLNGGLALLQRLLYRASKAFRGFFGERGVLALQP